LICRRREILEHPADECRVDVRPALIAIAQGGQVADYFGGCLSQPPLSAFFAVA
jgi:hypothetical protein